MATTSLHVIQKRTYWERGEERRLNIATDTDSAGTTSTGVTKPPSLRKA